MLAESGGLAPQPAEPIHLLSKQRPRLGGFALQNGGEQWSCPTSLAARNGFQPITALRGFALRKSGGGERSCSPATERRPIRLKRVPAPRPVSPPKVPAAGFAPASIRLEGGGLSFSAARRWSAGARKWRSPSNARVSRAGARHGQLGERSGPRGGTPTHNTAFEAPHDCNFTTRGNPSSLHGSFDGTSFGFRSSKVVPLPGIAPGIRPSHGRVIALSLQGEKRSPTRVELRYVSPGYVSLLGAQPQPRARAPLDHGRASA
jgi:hypothetical protein